MFSIIILIKLLHSAITFEILLIMVLIFHSSLFLHFLLLLYHHLLHILPALWLLTLSLTSLFLLLLLLLQLQLFVFVLLLHNILLLLLVLNIPFNLWDQLGIKLLLLCYHFPHSFNVTLDFSHLSFHFGLSLDLLNLLSPFWVDLLIQVVYSYPHLLNIEVFVV